MARIYRPRQRQSDGRWDMTVASDEERWCHPIGYCHAYRKLVPDPSMILTRDMCEMENRKTEPFISKYHADGHATAEEAEACWARFCLDQEVRECETRDAGRCLECNEWTPREVQVGPFVYLRLCEKHAAGDLVEKHFFARERRRDS